MLSLLLDGSAGPTPIRLTARAGSAVSIVGRTIEFDTGNEALYVSTAGGRVTAPAAEADRVVLAPGAHHRLTFEVTRGGDGEAALWIIEFSGSRKLAQVSGRIGTAQGVLTWRADPAVDSAVIALRLTGRGWLRVDRATLAELGESEPAAIEAEPAAVATWIEAPPRVDIGALVRELDATGIDRALIVDRERRALSRIASVELGGAAGRVMPAVAPVDLPRRFDPEGVFAANQLELAWQGGRLAAVDLGHVAAPPRPAIAAWLDDHDIPVVCRIGDAADAERVGTHLLARGSHPVIALFDRDAGDPRWAAAWLRANPRLHSLTGGTLGAVADDARRRREAALSRRDSFRFPLLPTTREDCRDQGFEILPPERFDDAEFADAKQFWKEYGVRSWYQVDKPWTGWLARWVAEIAPSRVLEFGCNVGRNLAGIRDECPGVELVGIDINAEAVAAGRERTGLDLRVADETSLRDFADGEFDAVFTVSVLDHMSDIREVCRQLLRVAARHVVLIEVRLPVEGRCVRHFDHKAGGVRPSTGASYSWQLERFLDSPRVAELAILPVYLHAASLGPYYAAYAVTLRAGA